METMSVREHLEPTRSRPSSPTLYFGYGSNLWLQQMRIRCPLSRYLGVARLDSYRWIINERGYANVVPVQATSAEPGRKTWPAPSAAPRENVEAIERSAPISEQESERSNVKQLEEEEEDDDDDEESKKEAAQRQDTQTSPLNYPSSSVYGLVYSLTPSDEAQLDINEGVPLAYTKEHLPCTFWSEYSPSARKIDTDEPPTSTALSLLVYIDRRRTGPAAPKEEYVYRMNRGIEDALDKGVPEEYVKEVLRAYIPLDRDKRIGAENETGAGAGADDDDDEMERRERERQKRVKDEAERQARRFEDQSGVF